MSQMPSIYVVPFTSFYNFISKLNFKLYILSGIELTSVCIVGISKCTFSKLNLCFNLFINYVFKKNATGFGLCIFIALVEFWESAERYNFVTCKHVQYCGPPVLLLEKYILDPTVYEVGFPWMI